MLIQQMNMLLYVIYDKQQTYQQQIRECQQYKMKISKFIKNHKLTLQPMPYLQLASQSEKNNFNVRRYQEKKSKRHSLPTKETDGQFKFRINTQLVQSRVKKAESVMSYTNAFDRIMNKNQPNFRKKMYLTGSIKNKKLLNDHSITKDITTIDIEEQKAQKCLQIDRKNNKGPLKNKMIQTWLNNILMESTQFEVLDETLGNAALKKFQIDQNSLLSRAVKPENIPRIYQTLFVHSIGFNNGIKQLVGNKVQVAKNIWKVFSVLLEYCAQGKFQTLVGIIQRQKAIKIEELRQQVARRQEIIQRNDQLNETKNIQIFKQIKTLKQQNINLTNQKQILFEDYQKTQQAFNEQVALRLKFENKINQLFGVHRQLGIKHSRLYDDYKRKVAEWGVTNNKNIQLNQQNSEQKIKINDLLDQKQHFLSNEKYNKELISALKQQKLKIKEDYSFAKHQYDEERRITKQLNRRLAQMQIELKNLIQIVQIKDKSWKQTHSEYQLSLEENNRLYNIISEQRVQVQGLLYEKKQFNNKILNLMADASFQKRKKQEFSKLYYDTDKKLKQMTDKAKQHEVEIKILSTKIESNDKDLQQNYQNIKKMHAKNSELEEELYYLRRFRDSLDEVLEQKDNKNQQYRVQNQKILTELQQSKTDFKKLQLSYKMLKQQSQLQIQNLKHKIHKIKEQNEVFQQGDNQKNKILTQTRLQLQKTMKILQNTVLDLKNEKFERFNLKSNYEQSLAMMEKKNIQQKQLGRQISELKQQVLRITQSRDKTQLALQNQTETRQKRQEQLAQINQKFAEHRQLKSSFVHPFVYQDLAELYRITKSKLLNAEITVKKKLQQIAQTHQKYKNQINSINKSNTQYFEGYKKLKEKELFLKQSELEYQKQTNNSMKLKLQKLEELAQTYAKKIQQRTTSEKQKIYSDLIQQKTKSIQELMQKLNMESTKNSTLKQEMIKKQQQFEHQVINLNKKFKTEKELRDEKINELNFQLNHIQKQAEKLKSQLKQSEQSFQSKLKERMEQYLQNYRKIQEARIKNEMQEHQNSQQNLLSHLQSKNPQPSGEAFHDTSYKWWMMNKVEKNNGQIKSRNNISKKLKIAYKYYQH